MIRQILVLDQRGDITKHIEKIFTGLLRGYQVFHATSVDEAVALAKKQMIDIVAINGNDFAKSFSADTMRMLKQKIYPPPKLLLLLEPNLLDTLPGLEGKADYVLNSTSFTALKFRRIVNDLVDKKYTEERQRELQEMEDKRQESEMLDQWLDETVADLERKLMNRPDDGEVKEE